MDKENAINEIQLASEKSNSKLPIKDIVFNFLGKCLLSYLPLSVFAVFNIPYLKEYNLQNEQDFLKGLFLALSYVFISQINNLNFKQNPLANFLYSLKLFCGICCIALFATNQFKLNLYIFAILFVISLFTLLFSNKNSKIDIEKMTENI